VLAYDQYKDPTAPWWPRAAINAMDSLLRPSDTCLEWGSGRSTVWVAARTKKVHSIEHDATWFERVRIDLAGQGVQADAVQLLDASSPSNPDETPYVRAIDQFSDGEIDVCIVDGEHRANCALAAGPKLAPGGLLVTDDIHWFIDHPTHAPHSRYGKGTFNADWERFQALVADWRCLWTTDGVTDTAIWIKPCNTR
jgi:predicted O-methyltransferase YrrM